MIPPEYEGILEYPSFLTARIQIALSLCLHIFIDQGKKQLFIFQGYERITKTRVRDIFNKRSFDEVKSKLYILHMMTTICISIPHLSVNIICSSLFFVDS